MRIGIIVLCRYNSKRFPGKILRKIRNKPIIAFILERLDSIKFEVPIYIATSTNDDDTPIVNYCNANKRSIFRGSKQNVAKRFLDCANTNSLDYAIRINGDNLFTDPLIIQSMIEITQLNKWDFLTNVTNRTFPIGVSVEIINIALFNSVIDIFNDYEREHVMPYFYSKVHLDKIYEYQNTQFSVPSQCQLAIDTYGDYKIASRIIQQMEKSHWEYSTQDIISIYKDLVKIND